MWDLVVSSVNLSFSTGNFNNVENYYFKYNNESDISTESEIVNSTITGETHLFQSITQSRINYTAPETTTSKVKRKGRPYEVSAFLVISLLTVLINLRVFCIVTSGSQRKLRPVSVLVAHLSSTAIFFNFILALYILEKYAFTGISAAGVCELLSFIRNGIYGVFPLNVIAIIYERIRTLRYTHGHGKLLVLRTVCLIWVVALLGNIPTIFLVKYEKDPFTGSGKCKQILLFGTFGATVAYEIFRLIVYHCLVVAYMIYAMFKIRTKIRYLYILKPIPNERMRRKVQRVRFVYLYSLVFVVVWLPSGFILFLYKLSIRNGFLFPQMKNLLTTLIIITYIYFILNPFIYVCMNEDIRAMDWCGIALCRSASSVENSMTVITVYSNSNGGNDEASSSVANNVKRPQVKDHFPKFAKSSSSENRHLATGRRKRRKRGNIKAIKNNMQIIESSDMSRISTVGISGTPSGCPHQGSRSPTVFVAFHNDLSNVQGTTSHTLTSNEKCHSSNNRINDSQILETMV